MSRSCNYTDCAHTIVSVFAYLIAVPRGIGGGGWGFPYVPITASKSAVRQTGLTELMAESAIDTLTQTPEMTAPMPLSVIAFCAWIKAEMLFWTRSLGINRPPICSWEAFTGTSKDLWLS